MSRLSNSLGSLLLLRLSTHEHGVALSGFRGFGKVSGQALEAILRVWCALLPHEARDKGQRRLSQLEVHATGSQEVPNQQLGGNEGARQGPEVLETDVRAGLGHVAVHGRARLPWHAPLWHIITTRSSSVWT